MFKKIPRTVRIGVIAATIIGVAPAALALDLSFLEGLTGPISKLTQIDEDYLNSGLGNLRAAQQVFRGNIREGAQDLLGANLGRLGLPDSTVNRVEAAIEDPEGVGGTYLEGYFRSSQVQEYVNRVLGREGQNEQGEELGKTEGYKTIAQDILQTSQKLAQQSNTDAQSSHQEAQRSLQINQQAQQCRSSQCVLKKYAVLLSNATQQNADGAQQIAGLTTGLSAQSTQIAALTNQGAIANRQRARLSATAAYQAQSLDQINGELAKLNYAQTSQQERNAQANQSTNGLIFLPNLAEATK